MSNKHTQHNAQQAHTKHASTHQQYTSTITPLVSTRPYYIVYPAVSRKTAARHFPTPQGPTGRPSATSSTPSTRGRCSRRSAATPRLRRGDHTVGNPHRAHFSQFESFELVLLLKVDKQFPVERFDATASRSTLLSPPLKTNIA